MRKCLRHTPLCLILTLVLVNIVCCFLFFRIDLTSNKRYSLSSASKNILKTNTKDISVDVYMSSGINQEEARQGKEMLYLLKEYKSRSNSRFTINIINTDNEEKRLEALRNGIEHLSRETNTSDMVRIESVFFGAVIRIGDKKNVIPYIHPYTPLEYEITRCLKEAEESKPKVGFLLGHDEIRPSALSQAINELSAIAQVEAFYISHHTELDNYKVICIVGPNDYLHPTEIVMLEDYLRKGGRLFIALNHIVNTSGFLPAYGFTNPVGLEGLLEEYGLKIKQDLIVDQSCDVIRSHNISSFYPFAKPFKSPFIPVIKNFSRHLITRGLHAMSLQYASSIEPVKTSQPYTFTWLARSSAISGTLEVPVLITPAHRWSSRDFENPHRIVSALLTNEENESAMIVVTDADFMRNNHFSPIHKDNINFAVNSIEWLADDTGLIRLRNKTPTSQTIIPIKPSIRILLQLLNFLLPLLIIGAVGLIIYRRKRIRLIRLERFS